MVSVSGVASMAVLQVLVVREPMLPRLMYSENATASGSPLEGCVYKAKETTRKHRQ